MSDKIEWGHEITINGKWPTWLSVNDRIQWREGPYLPDWTRGANWVWANDNIVSATSHIRLPANHSYYATAVLSDEAAQAALALVQMMTRTDATTSLSACADEARRIAKLPSFPKAVDPLLLEARKLAASHSERNDVSHADYLSGDLDSGDGVQFALTALRRGIELGKEGKCR